MVRLLSDFYAAMDSGQLTLLALFDVSSAFDTVDHSILLQRLSISFGLNGTPLECFVLSLQIALTVYLLAPPGPAGSLPFLVYLRDQC